MSSEALKAREKDPQGLTPRQRQIYEYIKKQIFERGYAPTVREVAAAFDIKSPNGVVCHLRALERKNVIRRHRRSSRAIQLVDDERAPKLPLSGVIAAGQPLEAIEQPEKIDFSDLFNDPSLFALQVRGDSMINDNIADGDYIIVRKRDTAENGQIVVALLNGQEATLKRYFRERNRIRLEAANKRVSPIYSKDVKILGVVVGVIRRYKYK